MIELDHVAIACENLSEGASVVERALGVPLQEGGQHPIFSTHNKLLGLGAHYLEVIATDPGATAPERPRWFDLDRFSGPPRLTNWIMRTDDMAATLAALGSKYGEPVALTRGDLRWRMAVPSSGILPFDNCAPAIIQWDTPPPMAQLTQQRCTLAELVVRHPDIAGLAAALTPLMNCAPVRFEAGMPGLAVTIDTPNGLRVLA